MPRRVSDPPPLAPTLEFEQVHWQSGARAVAGLDEAGRGALAGPVAAAAVVLPAEMSIIERLAGVRDSKMMTARQRDTWAGEIRQAALAWGIGLASPEEIEAHNIIGATRLAMTRALAAIQLPVDSLLVDALRLPAVECPQQAIVHGDARCLSIAAASVLAKTERDRIMVELDRLFPGYEFARHKGYATAAHRAALETLGPSPVHRRSFAPVRERASRQVS